MAGEWDAFPEVGTAPEKDDPWAAFPEAPESMSEKDMTQLSVDRSNGPMSRGEDAARSGATGLAEGVLTLGTMPGDMGTAIGSGLGSVAGWMGASPEKQQEIAAATRRATIFGQGLNTEEMYQLTQHDKWAHQPQYTTGEYARTVGSFVPGALALGPGAGVKGAIGNTIKYGVIPGLTSETAGQVARQIDPALEPYARLLGALTGAAGSAILSRPGTAERVLAGKLPQGVSPRDIDDAARIMQTGERMGIKLTWPEALARATDGRVNLTDLQRVVEQSKGGSDIMSPFMRARPGQVQQSGAAAFNELTAGAKMGDPVRVGLRIQSASKKTLDALRQRINNTTRKLYDAADIDMVDDVSFSILSRDPLFKDALEAVRELPEHSRFIAGLPDKSVGVFNEVKKYLDDIAGARSIGGKNQASSVYGGVAREVRDTAKAASPPYAKALERQETLRRNVLEPAEAGPLGKMAATEDLGQQGQRLFPTKPLEGSEKVVGQTVRRLVRDDPNSAFQLVRSNLRQVFDESTQANMGGANEFGGAKFAATIRGNAQQAKNLEAAIKALPEGEMRWNAFDDFLNVLETTGERLPANSATAFNQAAQRALRETGMVADVVTGTRTFGKSVMDRWAEFMLGKNSETLAKIFTDPSPRTTMLLKSLAASKVPSRKAQIAALLVYYAEAGDKSPTAIQGGGG